MPWIQRPSLPPTIPSVARKWSPLPTDSSTPISPKDTWAPALAQSSSTATGSKYEWTPPLIS